MNRTDEIALLLNPQCQHFYEMGVADGRTELLEYLWQEELINNTTYFKLKEQSE